MEGLTKRACVDEPIYGSECSSYSTAIFVVFGDVVASIGPSNNGRSVPTSPIFLHIGGSIPPINNIAVMPLHWTLPENSRPFLSYIGDW